MDEAPRKYGVKRQFDAPAESFNHCPNGHELPHTVKGVECSSATCGSALETTTPVSPVLANHEDRQFDNEVKAAQRGENYRRKLVPVPEGLTGGDAETYVEARLTNLSVVAVAELERQLRFGTDTERGRAAERILDATGHGKKDRTGGSTQLIIVNGVVAGAPLPWAKRTDVQVVDAAKALP